MDDMTLEVGMRPSRKRRHLPTAYKEKSILTKEKGSGEGAATKDTDKKPMTLFGISFCRSQEATEEMKETTLSLQKKTTPPVEEEYYQQSNASKRRRKQREKARQHLLPPSHHGYDHEYQHGLRSRVIRWLFWLGCLVWFLFLAIRLYYSYSEGDFSQLSLLHFLTPTLQFRLV